MWPSSEWVVLLVIENSRLENTYVLIFLHLNFSTIRKLTLKISKRAKLRFLCCKGFSKLKKNVQNWPTLALRTIPWSVASISESCVSGRSVKLLFLAPHQIIEGKYCVSCQFQFKQQADPMHYYHKPFYNFFVPPESAAAGWVDDIQSFLNALVREAWPIQSVAHKLILRCDERSRAVLQNETHFWSQLNNICSCYCYR